MEANTTQDAPKSDAITAEEAAKSRILIQEDIRKYELAQSQLRASIAQYDVYIAECRTALADLDRREAGVMYPPAAPSAAPANPSEGK